MNIDEIDELLTAVHARRLNQCAGGVTAEACAQALSYVVGSTHGYVFLRSGPSKGGVSASQFAQAKTYEGWTALDAAAKHDDLSQVRGKVTI